MEIQNKRTKRILTAVFIVYVVLLLGVVTLRFLYPAKLNQMTEALAAGEVAPNFEIFKTIRAQWADLGSGYANWNILANTVCFMPFGFLLPLITKKPCNLLVTGFIGLLFSGLIETSQLVFNIGVFDIDDLILNTAGVVIGYIAARVCYAIFGGRTVKKKR
ncbi:MAG: VanZ family protein [Ruminococcus sp.]|jgi:glycopeptide antibiotics resistance protein|nr:VanZ family protein [Ruminococcus sp.]